MLIKRAVRKEKKRRESFFKNYIKYLVYKSLYKNKKLEPELRKKIFKKLKKFRQITIAKQYKYCVFSSRIRGTYSQFKMSRHFLKDFASRGRIPGLFKL